MMSLLDAYAEALTDMPRLTTDERAVIALRNGGKRTYDYMSLTTLLDTVRQVFKRHNIAVAQAVQGNALITFLVGYGELREISSYPLRLNGGSQENGSEITYARRYSLYCVLGVMPDKDDDGAQAQNWHAQRYQRDNTQPQQWQKSLENQRQNLN